MSENINITVINWEKYQPMSDRVRRPHWFRFSRDSSLSYSLANLTAEQCWVWVQILSECCRTRCGTILINVERLATISKTSIDTVTKTIDILRQNGTIKKTQQKLSKNSAETQQKLTLQDITRQDITRQDKLICVEPVPSVQIQTLTDENGFFGVLTSKTGSRIKKLYPDEEFVNREVVKMQEWLDYNSHRTPKSKAGWSKFIMGWLNRGWESYRKSLSTNKATPIKVIDWGGQTLTGDKNE